MGSEGTFMVFCDLMNRLKTTELNTMNASTILHNMLRAVTPNSIHKARFNTLVAAVKSLLHCRAMHLDIYWSQFGFKNN